MDTDVVIIGAGVIGLGISSEFPNEYQKFVLEKNSKYGLETSSRNSEVIHSAINYPHNSLKAKFCLEGNHLMYEACSKYNIPNKKIGKLIIAKDENELSLLEKKLIQAKNNGVENISIIDKIELQKLEPNIKADAALFSQDTGIINAHEFMDHLYRKSKENNTELAFNHEVISIEEITEGYKIVARFQDDIYDIKTRFLINAAGLNAHKISNMLGFNHEQYYFKGDYFNVHNGKNNLVSRLIYHVVKENFPGLGIHIALSLNNDMRLGPDAYPVDEIDYKINEDKKILFYENVNSFFPKLELEDLSPGISGIRPKIQKQGFGDFYIKQDLPEFINLLGIDSPGLTSSLAIAKYVNKLLFR